VTRTPAGTAPIRRSSRTWARSRIGGNDAPSAQPNSGTFDEHTAFAKLNAAFPDLLGRHARSRAREVPDILRR
jgi:hypothetical protein